MIFDELVVIWVLFIGEVDGVDIFYADFFGDFADGFFVVTGDDFDFDIIIVEIFNDVLRIGAELVFEADETE